MAAHGFAGGAVDAFDDANAALTYATGVNVEEVDVNRCNYVVPYFIVEVASGEKVFCVLNFLSTFTQWTVGEVS